FRRRSLCRLARKGREGDTRRQEVAGRSLRICTKAQSGAQTEKRPAGTPGTADQRLPLKERRPAPRTLRGRTSMKTMKGPAIFLAQFAGDKPPYNTLSNIAGWAASLGYKGIQIPSWD